MSPETDGVTHINVYSKGKTVVGRWLSNFAFQPIQIEGLTFCSIEGYWYWLGNNDPKLKVLSGLAAKAYGTDLHKTYGFDKLPDFQEKIEAALRLKAAARPDMMKILRETDLPLVHYYFIRGKVVAPKAHRWVVEFWEKLRRES